ncbi:hypothetical protein B0H16DRAFT_1892262 [Mycena metata]|uniref:BHLH domain-containing protein n=1 Tax=Mycena metata TaxID=1033252 RepID=A0AAD7MW08_9AGAR|nr:hypothetical protein B0H16DRAFT_1892262 [Mycena metata]
MSTSLSFEASSFPTVARPACLLPSLSLLPVDTENLSTPPVSRSPADDVTSEKARDSTAARRASHNAVERQRRDKLNARIMELASLLPNLAGVRRPSRIAITKSSIAHVLSSRKHRILAAQQLRGLHAENESLRAEINQWRQRAGVPAVLEPRRDSAFMVVYTGAELELDPLDGCDDEEFEEQYNPAMIPTAPRHHPMLQRYPQSHSPFAYSVSPPSSSSGFPSPYSTPPTSANDFVVPPPPYAVNFDMPPTHDPRIVCPTPANPFEAQQFMLKTEDDEWASYSTPPTQFQDPRASW